MTGTLQLHFGFVTAPSGGDVGRFLGASFFIGFFIGFLAGLLASFLG
jgi:hypothetical protein